MKHRNLINSTLALILMAGCTDATGGTGVEPDDLAGIWTAESIVFTSAENSELTMDVANEGATIVPVPVSWTNRRPNHAAFRVSS